MSRRQARSHGSSSWHSPVALGLLLAGAAGAFWLWPAGAFWLWPAGAFWLWPAPTPVPEIDLSAMEPQVSAKLTEHLDAVRAAPDSAERWGGLGSVLLAHRLDEAAASSFEHAVALAPEEFRWHYLRAHALRSSDPEAALAQSALALELDDDYASAHVLHGELLEELARPDEAFAHYEKAATLDPDNPMAVFRLGSELLARGDVAGAQPLLERVAELDPEAGPVHGTLARLYRRTGDLERATAEARLAAEKRNPVTVKDRFHYRMRQESVSSLVLLDRAAEAAESGDLARARRHYETLVDIRPDDANILTGYAEVLEALDELEEAERYYLAALAVNPANARAHFGAAKMLQRGEAYDDALGHYRRARELNPDNVPTLVNLGSLLEFQGQITEAEELFREAGELAPDDFAARRRLGELLARQRRFEEAEGELLAAVALEPNSGPAHLALAVVLASESEYERALRHARRAEELGVDVAPEMLRELERSSRGT